MTSDFLFFIPLPPSILKLSRISPVKMRRSRSCQGIFIAHSAIRIYVLPLRYLPNPRLAHSCRSLSRFLKRLEVFLLPLDGMLVHRRSLPRNFRFPQQIAGTHLYSCVERGTVRVKCLAQEHNTLSPARALTRTSRSGVERTNHEATAKPMLDPQ